jgi:hypothetical protein
MCSISIIVTCSFVGCPVACSIQKSENANLTGGSYNEGSKSNRFHISSATGRKTVKNMKTMQIIQHTINGCVLG